ncbi:MAG: hypothetical protein HQL96_15715 [Magnetococcales bacterium]|nr:hypothetical protein [Magnetococcales bacterium]
MWRLLTLIAYGLSWGNIISGYLFYLLPPYIHTTMLTTEEATFTGIGMVTGGGILFLVAYFYLRKKGGKLPWEE